jgi:hypothetical protein
VCWLRTAAIGNQGAVAGFSRRRRDSSRSSSSADGAPGSQFTTIQGWPSQRLTRWATRDHPSLARAFRRGGFDPSEADRLSERVSDEWGEPVGDVADVVIPAAVMAGLAAIGTVAVGRWLLGRVTTG